MPRERKGKGWDRRGSFVLKRPPELKGKPDEKLGTVFFCLFKTVSKLELYIQKSAHVPYYTAQ